MSAPLKPLSAAECYHVLRAQVEHEDSRTTQRLSSLLAAQSFLSALIYVSILGGVVALYGLHRRARQLCAAGFPPLQGARATRLAGMASPRLVPPIFTGAWLYLMLRGLGR